MNYENFRTLKDIHYLANYEPEETRYARFAEKQPSVIAVGHKIIDTYQAFCRARAMLYYAYSENWGDLSDDNEISKLCCRSQMLIAAILEYSICLDISWQVIWASFQPASLSLLLQGHYKEMEGLCTSITVHEQLNCVMGLHGIGEDLARNVKSLLSRFENKPVVKEMREIYNAIKHRGTIHIEGLGENDNSLAYTVNGSKIPKLSRASYSIDRLETLILEYDHILSDYIGDLADILIPEDYKETKCSFAQWFESALNMKEALPEK